MGDYVVRTYRTPLLLIGPQYRTSRSALVRTPNVHAGIQTRAGNYSVHAGQSLLARYYTSPLNSARQVSQDDDLMIEP